MNTRNIFTTEHRDVTVVLLAIVYRVRTIVPSYYHIGR